MTVRELAQRAKAASGKLAITSAKTRNDALLAMADALVLAAPEILRANAEDVFVFFPSRKRHETA